MSEGKVEKWREDFPVHTEEDNYITRREFTRFLILVSGATFAGNGFFVLKKYEKESEKFPSLMIAHREELSPGQAKLFHYPAEDDPAILIRLKSGDYTAFRQRCTHLSCPVLYAASSDRLECPCHNGAFDAATGSVLYGPPPRPLPKIALRFEADNIYAEGVEGT